MPTTIRMPQVGETVADGTILRWARQVGDEVAEGDVLVEIATDKLDTEVPSPSAGRILELLVGEGETVDVGAPIAVLSGDEEDAPPTSTSTSTPTTPTPIPTPTAPSPVPRPSSMKLSPVVRRIAAEHDLDLTAIVGTGPEGRITRDDARAAVAVPAHPPPSGQAPARDPSMATDTLARKDVLTPAVRRALSERDLEASQVEATGLGGRLTLADVEGAPAPAPAPAAALPGGGPARGFVEVEVDFERVVRVQGERSVVAFVARAALDAIRSIDGVDGPLGFGGGGDDGVAVIPDADDLRLDGLARRIVAATPTDGTAGLVITHPGAFGASRSAPSMATGGVPLLAVNAVHRRPAVVSGPTGEESLAIRSIGTLGLTWDAGTLSHPIALALLQRIRENLESWAWEQELI